MRAATTRTRRGLRLAVAVTVAGAWAAGALHGQGPARDDGGVRLTLEEAVSLAERHNPAYRRTTNSLELNTVERREAWLRLLPRPQLSVLSTSMSWNLQHVGTDPFGNPLPNPEAQTVQSSQSRQQAGLAFAFDFAGYMSFRNRGDNAATRRVSAANHLHELHVDVWRTFLEVQQQQVTVALEEELLERQRRNQEIAGRLYALAQRQRIDLLEADLDVAVQEEQLRQSRGTLSAALLGLRNLVGDPELEIVAVEPIPFRELDPGSLDDDALVRAALVSSPAIVLQQAVIHQTRQQLAEIRWQQWLPSLSTGFSMSRTELERGGGGAFLQPNPAGGWERNISLQLSFPDLARGFENQNTAHRERIELRNADETLRERRLEVERSVRATLVDLRTAHASAALQERRVSLAEERLAERLDSYRLGRGTYQDLQTATDAVAAAERALLVARYQLERALITLEQTLGMPLERVARLGGS